MFLSSFLCHQSAKKHRQGSGPIQAAVSKDQVQGHRGTYYFDLQTASLKQNIHQQSFLPLQPLLNSHRWELRGRTESPFWTVCLLKGAWRYHKVQYYGLRQRRPSNIGQRRTEYKNFESYWGECEAEGQAGEGEALETEEYYQEVYIHVLPQTEGKEQHIFHQEGSRRVEDVCTGHQEGWPV